MINELCPCGSNKAFSECCESFIKEVKLPETAEKLMRSRYSAYDKKEIDYLFNTTYPEYQKYYDKESIRQWAAITVWKKLEVIRTVKGQTSDTTGQVEFKAYYSENGINKVHHELSDFKKENGKWFFQSGIQPQVKEIKTEKIGRNDPCPCGSGKKYKKCCGK